ncbi:MAG: inositol monophosphatase family protein [Bacteroidota bacterium]|nr:inositol monophosphatase family protein [Bacteroidota bacterium]
MTDLKEITLEVCKIARQAGEYQKKERVNFSFDSVEQKNSHDYVSYVDKSSEKLIVAGLKDLVPGAGFITEEETVTYNDEEYCWVIDPLDGTTNYIHDNAPYCVSIALRRRDEVLIGVVYEVCRDECFYAWKEGGAYLDGKPISVAKTNQIDHAMICIELPYDFNKYSATALHLINHFYGYAGAIRMNGSAATALCYVAAGRFDGWLEMYIGKWDFMAGVLIITEAGGTVTDFHGSAHYLDGNNIVASNGTIHEELLRAIGEVK